MNAVNNTLYIPLYCRAYVSKKGIIINDEKAQEIMDTLDFDLPKKCKSKWLCYYMAMRSSVFDAWVKDMMNAYTDAAVIHIGCGLDSRNQRIGTYHHPWYDIDFPDVIDERMKYFCQTIDYSMLKADATNDSWLNVLPHDKTAIIIMEGVSMYLKTEQLQCLLKRLSEHFEHLHILIDTYSDFAAKSTSKRNPVTDIGVTKVYGVDTPDILTQGTGLSFVSEHSLTPQNLIAELKGTERFIFKHLYAGSISKRLYKLFEYKK